MSQPPKNPSPWPGLGAGAAFGTFGVLAMQAHAAGLGTAQILAWRFLLASLLLLAILLLGPRRPRPAAKDLGLALLLGATLFTLQAYMFLGAIARLGAGLAAVLLYLYPALVALAQRRLGGPALGPGGRAALVLAFLGTALVGLSGAWSLGSYSVPALLLGFGTAAVYALYLLLSERLLRRMDPVSTALSVFAASGAVCFSVAALSGESLWPAESAWTALFALALMATVIPVLLLMRSMQALGAARTALLCTVEPVVALILGAWFLAERPLPLQWAGSALVLFGVVQLQSKRSKQP